MHARAIEHGMQRGRRQVPSAAHDTRTQILILHARGVRSRSLAGMSMSISLSRAGRAALRTKSSVIRGAWCRLRIHRCRCDAPAFQCVHAGGRLTVCECLPGYLTPKIKIASSFAQSLQGPNKPSPMRPWHACVVGGPGECRCHHQRRWTTSSGNPVSRACMHGVDHRYTCWVILIHRVMQENGECIYVIHPLQARELRNCKAPPKGTVKFSAWIALHDNSQMHAGRHKEGNVTACRTTMIALYAARK